ncbi:MAG TPA: 1-acyl-sn-glycerol-3-phosphate acyltransferase, partial [Paludibacteraceae bacterium]|nr:1-acyl-sn-glycerol-3-phosphate acyltransferase [Paludibacteraceae bacterium]
NHVNIEEMLGPKLRKKMPRFLINYLKKIVHESEMNEAIDQSNGLSGPEFFKFALDYLDISYTVIGEENLPKDGKYIFVGNHPLGGADSLIVGEIIRQHYGNDIRFISNSLVAGMKPLSSMFIPVNLLGGPQTRDFGVLMEELFESDNQVSIFPAGTCAKRVNGKITEMPWKKMFVTRAKKFQRDVIPIHCTGRNSNWFYFISNVSRFLGLKVNIGMMYLVDELFKAQHKHFTVTIGEPIPWQTFDSSKSDAQWANHVRKMVIGLGEQTHSK